MEGHERNLEGQSREEEDQRHDLERRTGEPLRHVVEIERADGAVQERDAVEHQSAGEQRAEDVFGSGLGRMAAVLVERHQTGRRDRRQFQPEEEHQEIARADHEEHAEQRRKRQQVELPLLVARIVAPQPAVRLEADQQRADRKDALDDAVHRLITEHAAEQLALAVRQDIDQQLHEQQAAGHGRKAAARPLPGEQVEQKEQDDHPHERHFGLHAGKQIRVIHTSLNSLGE